MSSQRKARAELREENKDPKNVTIIAADGGRKVLSWEEYQEYLTPTLEGVVPTEVTPIKEEVV